MIYVVGPGGLEPPTPALSTRCSNQLSYGPVVSLERTCQRFRRKRGAGGADRNRTDDLLLAKQLLFQLSYGPASRALLFRKNQPDKERLLIP